MKHIDIVEFCTDPQLLGLSLSHAQCVLLKAIFAVPMSDLERRLYTHCTGRTNAPQHPFSEVTVIAGARSGKDSRIAAPAVLYSAFFGGYEQELATGERGIIPLVAQDSRAARIAFNYIREYLRRSPLLWNEVEEEFASELRLRNGISIVVFPCTSASLRGWSIPVAVLDEVAFFATETGAADSDEEVQASVRRGQVSFSHPKLIKISTPFARSGVLYADSLRFGEADSDRLVWRAPTKLMNPTLTRQIERARKLDPLRAQREFDAAFIEDLAAWVPFEWVVAAIVPGRGDLPTRPGVAYRAAVDPSGGGADQFAFALAHDEGERVVVDVLRGWKSLGSNLSAVVAEIAATCRAYGVAEVVGDRYGAGWVIERFRDAGIAYHVAPWDKSASYANLEPLLAQSRVELPEDETLRRELASLERRPLPGGKIRVDHPPGGHDDLSNVVALLSMPVDQQMRYGQDFGVVIASSPLSRPRQALTRDPRWVRVETL